MIQRRISASISASALGVPELPGSTGNLKVALADANFSYNPDTSYAFMRRLRTFSALGDAHFLNLQSQVATGTDAYVAPVAQVETATAAGTIATAGNASVTVTSAGMAGSPLVIPFAVALSDTAATWAGKARAALVANPTVAARFKVSGSSTAIVLTRIVNDYGFLNDTTLNIALADVTSAGITEAATSANTTNGVLASGHIWERGDGVDAEGVDIPTLSTSVQFLQVKCVRGSFEIVEGVTLKIPLGEKSELVLGAAINSLLFDAEINFIPAENFVCELEIFGVMATGL